MSKYCEIEQLKADIKEAYKGKNEFMADAICSVIDKRAIKNMPEGAKNICHYCIHETEECGTECIAWAVARSKFEGRKVIFVE